MFPPKKLFLLADDIRMKIRMKNGVNAHYPLFIILYFTEKYKFVRKIYINYILYKLVNKFKKYTWKIIISMLELK